MSSSFRNIGEYVKFADYGYGVIATATDVASTGFDRTKYLSAVVHLIVGAPGSSYTNIVKAKVQDSPDGSTDWQDYTDPSTGTIKSVTKSAVHSSLADGTFFVDLSNARKYIRVFCASGDQTIAASGAVITDIVVGGASELPI